MEKIDWNDWFYYDESSPSCLRWKVSRLAGASYKRILVSEGDAAGCKKKINKLSRWVVGLLGKEYKVHRVIYEMKTGNKLNKQFVIDHLNGNSDDNRFDNLRAVDQSINRRNTRAHSKNSSGSTGVSIGYNQNGAVCFRARAQSLSGKEQCKYFNIDKLGIMVAFRDAVIYRQKMIEELNSQGAGYTERHGKDNK